MGRPEIVWKGMSRARGDEVAAFMKDTVVRQALVRPTHRVLLLTKHRRFRHRESPPCRGLVSVVWLGGVSHAPARGPARFTSLILRQKAKKATGQCRLKYWTARSCC